MLASPVTSYSFEASNAHRELKSHIGAPAQKHALELVHATQSTTENGIQALEKRIDALQTVGLISFPTHRPTYFSSYSSRIQMQSYPFKTNKKPSKTSKTPC